jgi:CRISPR/Cas system-associated protein Cas10 (large subunit of type III CRISPR-Cas system)
MPNPQLTPEERKQLFSPLFKRVVDDLVSTADGDPHLLWALRRKLTKELGYLERDKPGNRKKLKKLIWEKQGRKCAICGELMPERNSELDRTEALIGYREENVRLLCHDCHVSDQARKTYA